MHFQLKGVATFGERSCCTEGGSAKDKISLPQGGGREACSISESNALPGLSLSLHVLLVPYRFAPSQDLNHVSYLHLWR